MRINTGTTTSSITTTTTFIKPVPVVTCGGAGGYTVTIVDPRGITGVVQNFYNPSGGVVTLSTPSGNIIGPGTSNTSTFAMPAGSVASFVSDGANYVITSNAGGVTVASTGAFSEAVTASPSNAPVTISPTGSGAVVIAPATTGSLNNVTIGATTPAPATFTNLTVSGTASGAGFSSLYGAAGAVGSTTAGTGAFTTLTATGTTTFQQLTEKMVPVASPGSGTAQSYTTGDIFYITAMSANFIFNLTDVPTTTNRNIVVTLYLQQTGNPYYCNVFQINGVGQTIRWPGGNSNPVRTGWRTEIQTFNLTRTSGGSWVVTSLFTSYDLPFVTSGLISLYDFASTRTYPGSGTTVFDILGANNGTWNNTGTGAITGGIFTITGSPANSFVSTPINLSSANTYTVFAASRYNGTGPNSRGRIITASGNNWLMGHWGNSVANYFAEGWVSAVSAGGTDNTWRIYHATGNISGNNYQLWINGTQINNTIGGTRGPNGLGAGGGTQGEVSNGDVGFFGAYNKVLSSAEIQQNYAAFQARYGI
jgi:hypothetical protein